MAGDALGMVKHSAMTTKDGEVTELVPATTSTNRRRSCREWLREMPKSKKVAVGLALATATTGGLMSLLNGDPTPVIDSPGDMSGLRASLMEGAPQGSNSTAEAQTEPASKGLFRIGFSFLAGFSIGTFLRAVLKLAMIVLGFWLLTTFLLAYAGLMTVEWDQIDALWNQFTESIQGEWGGFQSFMLGSLPAAGLAATGLIIGLKRH